MKTKIEKLVSVVGIFSTITLICLMLSSFNNSTSRVSSGDTYTIVGTGSGIYKVKYNPEYGYINRVTKYTGAIY